MSIEGSSGRDRRDVYGCRVFPLRYNNRSYKIDELDFESTPQSTFSGRNGEETTFEEYYKKMYDITVKDKNQPLIVTYVKRYALGRSELSNFGRVVFQG